MPNKGKTLKKTLDTYKLIDAGLTVKEAMQATNMRKDISAAGVAVMKRKYKNYVLTKPGTVKLAENQVKRILTGAGRDESHVKIGKDGEVAEYTDKVYPTDTNILAAASMVYDRYDPVVTRSVAVSVDIDPVDLQEYLNATPVETKDE